jgi:acyl-CoA thioester hydrolase
MEQKRPMTKILPHSGIMKGNKHIFPLRVYYEDTDVGGVVYYANYLKYMERARSEMIRALGIDQLEMLKYNKPDDVSFVVRRCEVDYKSAAYFDDLLTVETEIIKLGGASILMKQVILKDDVRVVESLIKAAVIGEDGKTKRLPKTIKQKFEFN